MTTPEELAYQVDRATDLFLTSWKGSFHSGLTDADPATGQRWTPEQVLGHVTEMLDYWLVEVERIIAGPQGVDFGRTKATPSRLTRIDRYSARDPQDLTVEITAASEQWIALLNRTTSEELSHTGTHPTLGEMTAARAIQEFVTDHLAEHTLQLRELERKEN